MIKSKAKGPAVNKTKIEFEEGQPQLESSQRNLDQAGFKKNMQEEDMDSVDDVEVARGANNDDDQEDDEEDED